MKLNIFKIQQKTSTTHIINFFKNLGLEDLVSESSEKNKDLELYKKAEVIKPVLNELFFLYKMITLNNRLTVLEFGSGFSTLLMALALNNNKKKLKNHLDKVRKSNIFELYALENEKKYLKITKERNSKYFKKLKINPKVHYLFSQCNAELLNGNIVHLYSKLPQCIPDMIYLDGPGQFQVKGNVNNISFAHNDFAPISADILKIEFLLNPGTIIVVDGRYHNANYLKINMKRNWKYNYVKYVDKHLFYLDEQPTGFVSQNLLSLYALKEKNV